MISLLISQWFKHYIAVAIYYSIFSQIFQPVYR